MENKRGRINKLSQSQIVSTVLLILISILAIILVFGFVGPFIKERLSAGNCLDVVGKIEISSGYTCYNGSATQVQVHIGEIRDLIEGVSIELGGATSKNYKIINGTQVSEVLMCSGNNELELPDNNEERTYIINNIDERPEIIRIYPILKGGRVCDASDAITNIDNCLDEQKCL